MRGRADTAPETARLHLHTPDVGGGGAILRAAGPGPAAVIEADERARRERVEAAEGRAAATAVRR